MGHDNGLAGPGLGHFIRNKPLALHMPGDDLAARDEPGHPFTKRRRTIDFAEIEHLSSAEVYCGMSTLRKRQFILGTPWDLIIGPERRADDPDVINYECFVLQNVDVVSIAAFACFSQGTADGVPIVVVVSENEHDRDCWSNLSF